MLNQLLLHLATAWLFVAAPPTSFSKAQLANITCIYDLAEELPKDIKVYTMHIVAKKDSKLTEFGSSEYVPLSQITPSGCDVSQQARDFLSQVDPGQKVYFDIKYQRAEESLPRVAAFAVFVTE